MRMHSLLCAAGAFFLFETKPALAETPKPVDQAHLNRLLDEDRLAAFDFAFEAGDEITEANYTQIRGAGAGVSDTARFTRLPRADLNQDGQWATHEPRREGGPQAQSCIACHGSPIPNGAGPLAVNVVIDPLHSGDPAQFLERNTLHLFGLGAVQRIAEEMTTELKAQEALIAEMACMGGQPLSLPLHTKGVSFGSLSATPTGEDPCTASIDRSDIEGVDSDLVVRAFGWKGNHATLRAFTRSAAHNEMGLQAVELVGTTDGDHDGITSELSVGDITAATLYMAALERPTSHLELAKHGLIDMAGAQKDQLLRGEQLLADTQCTSCHIPTLSVDVAVFTEPSRVPGFAEPNLPDGSSAMDHGLYSVNPMWFDLTSDQPNNRIAVSDGGIVKLGSFPRSGPAGAEVTWYSDFRRHEMGPALADPVDAFGFGASVWPTRSLAGVGSTGPWLHNGHATTLNEAIMAHGGEAHASRAAYIALPDAAKADLIAFLENLVIVNLDSDAEDH